MPQPMRYTLSVLLTSTAIALSVCGTPSPAGNASTAVPTNTGVPATATVFVPPPTDTIAPATARPDSDPGTPTGMLPASPVTGSVLVEGGNSMTGGVAGEIIDMSVTFTASSAAGRVTDMRVDAGAAGCAQEAMESYPWEPFEAEKVYTTTAFINFQGWYVNVQYRDAQGNVSPVYCDDISIEGMPARRTP